MLVPYNKTDKLYFFFRRNVLMYLTRNSIKKNNFDTIIYNVLLINFTNYRCIDK